MILRLALAALADQHIHDRIEATDTRFASALGDDDD